MNAPALPTPDFSRFPRYAELTASGRLHIEAVIRAGGGSELVLVEPPADKRMEFHI